jgi:hypothetical protein
MALDKEKENLFRIVRRKLGGSARKVELTDDDLCNLLELAIGDYAQEVQNFIIESNWAALFGKQTGLELSNQELAFALSMRSLDMSKDYASWFSKQVGHQTYGKYELKKDFIQIEKGKQVYYVPPGREINKVMWVTPPTTDAAIWGNYGGLSTGFGGGVFGQMGAGAAAVFGGVNSTYGMGAGIWALPAYDVALMATDLSFKQQLLRSDLVYKVTASGDGGHLIHLMSTPGSKFTFGAGGVNTYPLYNCYLWYTYYDMVGDDADECRRKNPDVILSPDQVPLDEMDYSYFNAPTKALIRQLLIAHAAETLGLIRGKFSGQIGMINNQLVMDYNTLISLGQRERDNALNGLKERLQRMTPYETMKRQAELVQSLKEVQKGTPLGLYSI